MSGKKTYEEKLETLAMQLPNHKAAKKLIGAGAKTVPVLLDVFENKNIVADVVVNKKIVQKGLRKITPDIVNVIFHRIGRPAARQLLAEVQKPGASNQHKHYAIEFLGSMGKLARGKKIINALIAMLDYAEGDIPGNAAFALGKIGDMAAYEALANHLEDTRTDVSALSALGLGKLGDIRIAPAILEIMNDKSKDEFVRSKSATSLGILHYSPAVPSLVDLFFEGQESDSSAAIFALCSIRDTSSVPLLVARLPGADDWHIRFVIGALGDIGHESCIPPLLEFVKGGIWELTSAAALALAEMGAGENALAVIFEKMAADTVNREQWMGLIVEMGDAEKRRPAWAKKTQRVRVQIAPDIGGLELRRGLSSNARMATGLMRQRQACDIAKGDGSRRQKLAGAIA